MNKLLVSIILFGGLAFGQSTTLSAQYDGTVPNTTITVASATGISNGDNLLLCSNQVVSVSSKAGAVLTVAQVLGNGNASTGTVCAIGTPVTDITQTPSLTFNAESWNGLQTWLVTQVSGTQTTLTTALASGDAAINVASTTGFGNTDTVIVCGEAIATTAKTATTLTIGARAQWGTTTPATCANGTVIQEAKYKSVTNFLKKSQQGIMAAIMQQVNTASIAAQAAALANAQAAPAAVASAVQ